MLVATTRGSVHGAAVLMYPGFLKAVSERIGSFYILPSSVHEILLIPEQDAPKAEDLNLMVYSVNRAEVIPEERLSDIAYHFDAELGILETAQGFENRVVTQAS